jgi:uncharacterized protein YhjY with autotransporter beta-barrel domain/phospholipase/lecithinase/hemolysin
MRISSRLLLAATSAMLFAAPAAAQRVERIVAFGDSYADDGNIFELTGSARPAIYPNGRFSNGTNFIDTMSQLLNVPVDNFAIGGAQSGNTNVSGPGLPGFALEYQSFLAGGGPAAFPRVSGKFAPNDLLAISIGGNDARGYQRSLGTNPTSAQIATLVAGAPAKAATSVAEATTGLNALVGAGARNITFLAGDVGRLPEVAGTPIAAVGTAFSASFNSGIQTTLAGYANQGVIVNYLDLNRIASVVEGNLSKFGLISAGACPTACVTTDPSLLDKYLFYVDQLHLTSRGFEIVGQYAVQQLEAPLGFQAQTDLGLSSARGFGQLMSGRLDLGGEGEDPLSFYLVGTTSSHDVRTGRTTNAYEYDSVGAAAGAEYVAGPAMLGVAVSYARPEVDFLTPSSRSRSGAWQVGAYGNFEAGGAFAEGYAGYGWMNQKLRRRAVIDEISAEMDARTLVAGGEAGYLMSFGSLKAGPVIGVQYARVRMDGYAEQGDPVLTLNVQGQRASETDGFVGVEAQIEADVGGLSVKPFVKLLAEKQLDSSGGVIRYASTSAPTIVNTFRLDEQSDAVYGRIEGGASMQLSSRMSLELGASATFEHPEHNEFSGFLGVKIGF